MNYQKTYQNKIGSASLNIKEAIVGKNINCRLTYKVGKLGIDDSGSMKVLFRIVTDAANPQFDDPKAPNYAALSSNRKDIHIIPGLASGGLIGKVDERPWCKGFILNFTNGYFTEGDEIYIDFKNWRVQTFVEKTFEFRILVDPFATARYVRLVNSPEIKILPDKPERLVIVAPSLVQTGSKYQIYAKLEDKWGNPTTNVSGEVDLVWGEDEQSHSKVKITNGKGKISMNARKAGIVAVKGSYSKLKATSNPILIKDKVKHNYYWADLHGQSEETVGTNDVFDYFKFARDYAFLDACCTQCNDFQVTDEIWKTINKATKQLSKDGKFVAIPGYEWSGNTSVGGDRNVLYRKENMPIYRSSHALIDDFSDIKTDKRTAKDLFKQLKTSHKKDVFAIAHVGGRYADLVMHDDSVERAVEVHSDWGTFEWFLNQALENDYIVGVVANSDGHNGRPGASYPSFSHFNTYGGLTCILANELTRDTVFDSIYSRQVYGTTGARIYLDVKPYMMGKVVKVKNGEMPSLDIEALTPAPLDKIEVFNKSKLIHTYYPEMKEIKKKAIKIIWKGSGEKGRNRKYKWDGDIKVKGAKIAKMDLLNFYNKTNYANKTGDKIEVKGETTGGIQGMILRLDKNEGEISVRLNGKVLNLDVSQITQKVKVKKVGGLDAQIDICQTHLDDKYSHAEFTYKLRKLNKGNNPIYIKATQKDGHMAWSSPIYFQI